MAIVTAVVIVVDPMVVVVMHRQELGRPIPLCD